jgi:pyrroline-5-carboxylate reductase
MNYAFIGLGNMVGAILKGMKESGSFKGDGLFGFDVDAKRAMQVASEVGLTSCASAGEAIGQADVVVLAVKPQTLSTVLNETKGELQKDKLVISIAAGKPLSFYEAILGNGVPLIRVMPSLLAKVSAASSAICANAAATPDHLDIANKLFSAVGTVSRVPERLFPAFSAISGAAPAFVFEFIDALASAGVKAGLNRELAQQTACAMVQGSAQLLKQATEHPRALMDQVCSPGGTTIRGVHALAACGFDHAVHEAVAAVIDRDQELGRDNA